MKISTEVPQAHSLNPFRSPVAANRNDETVNATAARAMETKVTERRTTMIIHPTMMIITTRTAITSQMATSIATDMARRITTKRNPTTITTIVTDVNMVMDQLQCPRC